VNAAAQECARSDDDAPRGEASTFESFDADDALAFVEQQTTDSALHRRYPRMLLDKLPNRSPIETAVALGARCPNSRSLAAIEHSKLEHGEICCTAHDPTKRIDLTYDGSLGHTTDGRIAGHLTDGFEGTRYDCNAGAGPRGRYRRLGTGVTGADNDNIELGFDA